MLTLMQHMVKRHFSLKQFEFSIPGGIKPFEIEGAYSKQGGKIVGGMIKNPNYGGR